MNHLTVTLLTAYVFLAPTSMLFAQECIDPKLEQIKSGTKIMLCDGTIAEGTKVETPDCTTDGQTNCVAKQHFKAAAVDNVSAYDIRSQKSFAGITGKFKLGHCRSGVRNSIYNNDATTPGTGAGNQTNGTDSYDWWDTVDLTGNGLFVEALSARANAPWDDKYFCDGTQITEVTGSATHLMPTNAAVNCAATTCTAALPFTKIFYDPYTQIYFTNLLMAQNGGAATLGTYWDEAVSACYNLNSGDGIKKWRVPTQMEAMLLAAGGLIFLGTETGMANAGFLYTASTTNVAGDIQVWNIGNYVTTWFKGSGAQAGFICVR